MNDSMQHQLSISRGRHWLAQPRVLALGVAVALALPCGSSAAQTNAQQKAMAEALFEEATKLMEEGQYGAACERFDQAQRADPGVGTLLNLGRCYALTGRLASAWAIFREAASAARASGQGDRARVAEENARELRPRLSELALLVAPGQPRGYELLLDGNLVSSVQFGLSVPVDAGQHSLLARAPGHEQWSSVLQIPGSGARKTVQVPPLLPLPTAAAPSDAAPVALPTNLAFDGEPQGAPPGPTLDPGTSGAAAGQKWLGLLVGGGGLLAIGAGAAIGSHAQSVDDEAKRVCGPRGCYDRTGEQINRSARHWAIAANVSYGAGALALGTGALLYLTAHDEQPRAAHSGDWQLLPALGAGPGVFIDGKF